MNLMSKYFLKEEDKEDKKVDLPLTTKSIEKWIKEKLKNIDLEDPISVLQVEALKTELYKDVLVVIASNAGHAPDLAKAALVLEIVQEECEKIKEEKKKEI